MDKYKPRIIDKLLKEKLEYSGAILIEGVKWCGKTTTGEHFSQSQLYMDNPDHMKANCQMAELKPSFLLSGNYPRLIDEWQIAPQLWGAARYEVDHSDRFGLFILSGSSVPTDLSSVHHTGTGRINRILMRPMSLYESGDSTGAVSLADLFADNPTFAISNNNLEIEDIAFITCRGGWPQTLKIDEKYALKPSFDYCDGLINDMARACNGVYDKTKISSIMRSLARNQGSQISNSKIANDISSNDSMKVSDELVAKYINAIKNVFAIEDLPAWNPSLRSKSVIRVSDTRYFVDPSIATAALRIGPMDLMNDLNTFGFIFKTLCVRDLRIYASAIDGDVYRYRDKSGLECDAVIHLKNGKYGLIEIKLGGSGSIDKACESLIKLEKLIDLSKMNKPSFKMVLVGVEPYAYKRNDGIYVVPIGCLKD